MGKGKKEHEEVIEFLRKKYGECDDCTLKYIYPPDWSKKWRKERPLSCDYIVNTPDKKAIVDVIFNEGWMETLGKVIAYFYEIQEGRQSYELWIITNCKGWLNRPSTSLQKVCNGNEEKYIDYQRDWYRLLKEISLSVIKPELKTKLRFFDFTGNSLEEL